MGKRFAIVIGVRPGQGPAVSRARVYAKVTRKVRDGYVCVADRSQTIEFRPPTGNPLARN